jgi:hypothetical protein
MPPPTKRTRALEAKAFLEALWGPKPPPRPDGLDTKIALWTKSDKTSHYFSETKDAARLAAERETDVYASVSLAPKSLGNRSRVKNANAAGIAGLWADVDVVGGPEGKKVGAPSLESALELVEQLPQKPTLTITSGYGLQAWWLLEEPWIFGGDDERARAAQVAAGWIALLDAAARQAGYAIDHTQDLARLMRVPGTFNGKGGEQAYCGGWPGPVADQDGPRYELDALAARALKAAPSPPPRNGSRQMPIDGQLDFDPNGQPPYDLMEALLENDPTFAKTWRHQRRDARGWSTSEYDLSLASQAVLVGWTDKQIADLLAAHRRRWGGEKLDRPQYFEDTIAKAREQSRPDPDATISAFNRVVGGPQVKEFVQDGRDPQTARFTLVLANGDQVRLGRANALMSQDRFREAFAVVTGHVLTRVKMPRWDSAVQALLKVRHVRESEDDTPEGTVGDWLSRYLYERLPSRPGVEAKDEACRTKEPFEEESEVFVFAASFGGFVRQMLRVNVPDHEVKDMLRQAGFERRTVHYETGEGRVSTRSYYAGLREGIE